MYGNSSAYKNFASEDKEFVNVTGIFSRSTRYSSQEVIGYFVSLSCFYSVAVIMKESILKQLAVASFQFYLFSIRDHLLSIYNT
jgi:hypothetical protein